MSDEVRKLRKRVRRREARRRWGARVMVAGLAVFVGSFVVALPVFGIGWEEADPDQALVFWRVPLWLGLVSASGFMATFIRALVKNDYE